MLSLNRFLRSILLMLLVAAAAGCAYPSASLTQGGQRPTIAFTGAPTNAEVLVDGIVVGTAGQYDGTTHVLVVEPGAHQIQLREAGQTIYQQRIYLASGESRVIAVGK